MNNYPTAENPDGRYKFSSFSMFVSPDLTVTERSTYSILEWLGDIGGLYDALFLICSALVKPFSSFWLTTEMISAFFREVSNNKEDSASGSVRRFANPTTMSKMLDWHV